jgi:hypothetical protein
VRPLGELWTLSEGQGEMPGCGPMRSLMTLGYDPQRKRFVGTFVASMITHLWIYDGALDASGRVLTLETEGPGMGTGEAMAKYRDVIEIASGDERSLTSNVMGDDGKWHEFMVARYRRRK